MGIRQHPYTNRSAPVWIRHRVSGYGTRISKPNFDLGVVASFLALLAKEVMDRLQLCHRPGAHRSSLSEQDGRHIGAVCQNCFGILKMADGINIDPYLGFMSFI
jgi:hypothetical protein